MRHCVACGSTGAQRARLGNPSAATTYDAGGRVLTIAYANGVSTTYTYSPTREWLSTVSTAKGGTVIQSVTYTRDFAGRITGIDGNRAEDDWTYGYDALDHLLSAANTNVPALSQGFTYDLGGKLTSHSSVGSYVYPAQGTTAFQPHAVTTAGRRTFAYDLNGNQLSRATAGLTDRSISYDNDNRPISVTTGGATVTYLYGPDGERLKKLTSSGTTLYLADAERDPAGGWITYLTATNPNRVGTGTTADAIRLERLNGSPVGGRFHTQKGIESVRALENWLAKNPTASEYDRMVAKSLGDELKPVLSP